MLLLTDWAAGKQFWTHGPGEAARTGHAVQVPAAWYGDIQEIVDGASPRRQDDGRWVLERADRRLVVRVRNGLPEVLTYYRRGRPRN